MCVYVHSNWKYNCFTTHNERKPIYMKQYFKICGNGICWDVTENDFGHKDSLEFSGKGIDCIINYGVDCDGKLILSRYNAFPSLRMIPNDTHGTLAIDYDNKKIPKIISGGKEITEFAKSFYIDGILTINSCTADNLAITRRFVPSQDKLIMCEIIEITNNSDKPVSIHVTDGTRYGVSRGTTGVYIHEIFHDASDTTLAPSQNMIFCLYYSARRNELKYDVKKDTTYEELDIKKLDWKKELDARKTRLCELDNEAKLDTGNAVLDMMYKFCKTRAGESIFATKGGLLHSPGGRSYYAATWCNDQVEYAGPWFAFTDDTVATHASMNAYRHYMPFMSEEHMQIPCSVIAEGCDIWERGDRGDSAMYLYGASLYAVTNGNALIARELWPAIKWCAEYCEINTLPEGVIWSTCDELEGRFPTDGKANLSTSALAYGGYKYAAMVADFLGKDEYAKKYTKKAESLARAIENYFGADMHGYRTYRYSAGFDTLRAWICLPMCMGLTERLDGTLDAMFSDYLWTENGMLTCERGNENKSDTIWDRSTLYGFRGAFKNGKFGNVWTEFMNYCNKRLLGERTPYAIEAWPEGDMRHLSAESALFCRIISEGILAIQPESMREFSFIPRIPDGMDHIYLSDFRMCGDKVSIKITKDGYEVKGFANSVSGTTLGERVVFDTKRA